MNPNHTDLVVLQDRSGSMGNIRSDVIGGFNTFVHEQRKAPGWCTLTLIQFDHITGMNPLNVVFRNMDVREVPELTEASYEPRGDTPLLYSVGKAIEMKGEQLSMIPEHDRPGKVIVLIMTDGYENASHMLDKEGTYSKAKIAEMVKHQEETYKWSFIFIGANIDAFAEAGGINIPRGSTMSTSYANYAGTVGMASSNIANYRSTKKDDDLNFTAEQREQNEEEK
jgi:hypothetical protein